MRSVELAVYADDLCAEAASLAARAERARSRLRVAALEREARHALAQHTVERLELLGILGRHDQRALRAEVAELEDALAAIADLQAWIEQQLELERS